MTKDFYTVRDIAEQLQISEKTVRRFISSRELEASKVCNKWIVSAEDLDKFMKNRKLSK